MDKGQEDKILQEAILSWKNKSNQFNYISLKEATTLSECRNERDEVGNKVYVKSNLDKRIIHFGQPSNFNDRREFEFNMPEMEWLGFLICDDSDVSKFKEEYEKTKDFEKSLDIFSKNKREKIKKLQYKLKRLGKTVANKYKDNYGIYCLAPSSYNSYFWENYCNDYNGICCQYDIETLCQRNGHIIRLKVEYDDRGVDYLPEYVDIEHFPADFDIRSSYSVELTNKLGLTPSKGREAALRMMHTKPEKWYPELETRLIIMLKDHNGVVVNNSEISLFPIKICVGYRVSDELKKYFKILCTTNNIGFEIVDKSMCVDFARKLRCPTTKMPIL